ncbi:hypothetical protein [Pseudooceanicola sp. 200-1SW]|uniref:COG4223 family protein n=1 Tax=Pseudooceanicola sp. 200-1SW TaxID=3425949 RepID=UPI003D7F6A4B
MAQTRDDETENRSQTDAEASQHEAAPEEDVTTEAGLTAPEHDPKDDGADAAPALNAPEHDPREGAEGTAPAALPDEELADLDEESPLAAGDDRLEAEDTPAAAPAEETPEEIRTEAAPTGAETAPARRGGFGAALLGGVVAAGIGFGAAMIAFPPVDTTALEQAQRDQAAAIEDMQAQLDAGPDLSALSDVTTGLSDMETSFAALQSSLDSARADLDALTARVDALEKQPLSESVSDAAIAAYEDELARLQQAMEDQRAEIEGMVNDSQQMRADAAATARDTQIRAALVRLNGALDQGEPFEAPLKTLAELGLEVPAPLEASAPAGVPTMARLRDDFPEAARDALAATRDGSLGGSFNDFLKNQLGARSLTPQEGSDPDAILSRAEAALKDGDLQTVLVELDGLPEPALLAMGNWMDLARTRAEAEAAAETLSDATTK